MLPGLRLRFITMRRYCIKATFHHSQLTLSQLGCYVMATNMNGIALTTKFQLILLTTGGRIQLTVICLLCFPVRCSRLCLRYLGPSKSNDFNFHIRSGKKPGPHDFTL